jgi:DNA invertase Pin-like site-specific DNA recombinase
MILPPLPESHLNNKVEKFYTAADMAFYGGLCIKAVCGGKHRGPKFSAKDVAYIRELYAQGFAYKAVSRQIEMSEATFYNITKRRGAYK